jgi:hypothetical protein
VEEDESLATLATPHDVEDRRALHDLTFLSVTVGLVVEVAGQLTEGFSW